MSSDSLSSVESSSEEDIIDEIYNLRYGNKQVKPVKVTVEFHLSNSSKEGILAGCAPHMATLPEIKKLTPLEAVHLKEQLDKYNKDLIEHIGDYVTSEAKNQMRRDKLEKVSHAFDTVFFCGEMLATSSAAFELSRYDTNEDKSKILHNILILPSA